MAAWRGSAYGPPRISSDMMKRALRSTGKAERPTTDAQEFLGGRYALPRDAAMTIVGLVGAYSIVELGPTPIPFSARGEHDLA